MADSFNADVKGLEQFISRFQGADKIVIDELKQAGQRAGFAVERMAKGRVRVWRGHLRRSIATKTTTANLISTTTVGTNVIYAKAEEFGRPAGAPMPPSGALLPWMRSKGIAPAGEFEGRDDLADAATTARPRGGYFPVEYLIARAIKRKAPDPHPFLLNSFKELQPKIREEFEAVPKRVIARLRGAG